VPLQFNGDLALFGDASAPYPDPRTLV
jgi:hypothetical protein